MLAAARIDDLFLCAMEWQRSPRFFPHVAVHYAPLDDADRPLDPAEERAALDAGANVVRLLRSGRRVLVTCSEGRNRSGLVVAIALVQLGFDPEQSIALVRTKRGADLPALRQPLANPRFVEFVRRLRPLPRRAMMA